MRRVAGRQEQRIFDASNWAIPAPSASGIAPYSADPRTPEAALQAVAIWGATNLIASVCSTMPIDTYRRLPDGTSVQVDSPALITDPSGEGYGVEDWLYQYLMSQLLRGNAYGQLGAADRSGYPAQIVLFDPASVYGWRDRTTGEAQWVVGGVRQTAPIWHQRMYPAAGQLLGLSPIERHALTIGQNISAAQFGARWFSDGAHPSSVLRNTEAQISGEKEAREIKARYMAAVHGTREPVVLGRGWEVSQIQVSAEESQFLATQRYTAADCARIYGAGLPEILGYETGGSMTYANVEQRSTDLLTYTLDPWLTRTERMFTALLPRGRYVKFNRGALLRTDLLTRYRAHAIGIAARFLHPSEAREFEDLPPLTDAQTADLATMSTTPPADPGGGKQ
jgi:HK97 family phage portal protein